MNSQKNKFCKHGWPIILGGMALSSLPYLCKETRVLQISHLLTLISCTPDWLSLVFYTWCRITSKVLCIIGLFLFVVFGHIYFISLTGYEIEVVIKTPSINLLLFIDIWVRGNLGTPAIMGICRSFFRGRRKPPSRVPLFW